MIELSNPIQSFVFEIMMGVKNGQSLSQLLEIHVRGPSDFHREISLWWLKNQNRLDATPTFSTDHRKILSEILESGLRGGRILEHLHSFYEDVEERHDQNMQNYLERLPFRLMLPLVLCFFPSILALLFGPLLQNIYREVL